MAISDMSIMDELTPAKLADCAPFLRSSGLSRWTRIWTRIFLTYACDLLDGVPLFFDPVSASKAARAKSDRQILQHEAECHGGRGAFRTAR